MAAVPVTKLHGTRNDFALIDERAGQRVLNYGEFAKAVCERHTGVGADGVLVLLPSSNADVQMRIFNSDGSEAEMCGNGIRCVARYLHEAGEGDRLHIETKGGPIATTILSTGPYAIRVAMGTPVVKKRENLDNASFVTLGNPHVVLFATSFDDYDLDVTGPKFNAQEPGGINVHIAVKAANSRLLVRHWERGAGRTMACGTGAVAAAAAAIARGDVSSPVEVNVPGGRLMVEWDGTGEAFLSGPAERVFDTAITVPDELLATS